MSFSDCETMPEELFYIFYINYFKYIIYIYIYICMYIYMAVLGSLGLNWDMWDPVP